MDPIDVRPAAAFAREGWSPQRLASQVRSGALLRVRRNVYAPAEETDANGDHLRRIAAACQRWHEDCVVSHASAAALHGIAIRRAARAVIHLSRAGAGHGKLKAGVRVHRSDVSDDEITLIGGLRVTSLERTLADLARCEPYEWGVVAADAVLRRQGDTGVLTEYVERWRGRPGIGRLRAVLAFADPRAESALESMSRVSIVRAGIALPDLQRGIADAAGGWVATADFAWEDQGVVGEADGRGKYLDDADTGTLGADAIMVEKRRDQAILGAGWLPTHWGWDLATNHQELGRHLRAVFGAHRRWAS